MADGVAGRYATRQNVSGSDGTLAIHVIELTGGTPKAVQFCEPLKKPPLVLD